MGTSLSSSKCASSSSRRTWIEILTVIQGDPAVIVVLLAEDVDRNYKELSREEEYSSSFVYLKNARSILIIPFT